MERKSFKKSSVTEEGMLLLEETKAGECNLV